MAISVTQLNAVTDVTGTGKGPTAIKHAPMAASSTTDDWYVIGGVPGSKRSKWVTTTRAESAADQGAAVLTAMANPAV